MKSVMLKAIALLAVLLCSGTTSAFADEVITQDKIKYELFDDGTAAVRGAESYITTANIPEKITHGGGGGDYTVTSIGDYAFANCSSLASVDIPSSVTNIERDAFYGCTGLKKLVCNATTPPVCQRGVFIGVDKNECTLYVPQESLDAYKSAARWKDFFNITTGIKDAVKTSSATEEARYSADGTRLASPQKGINIIRMSDGTVKKVLVK